MTQHSVCAHQNDHPDATFPAANLYPSLSQEILDHFQRAWFMVEQGYPQLEEPREAVCTLGRAEQHYKVSKGMFWFLFEMYGVILKKEEMCLRCPVPFQK